MPIYSIPEFDHNIARNAVLLDTNVLVAGFHPRDQNYEIARVFLDEYTDPFIVPISVVVESWGMLVGSYRNFQAGAELLAWLVTPGNVDLFPEAVTSFDDIRNIITSIRVDCVDAMLAYLAHDISKLCNFDPHIRIATFDTSDMLRCRLYHGLELQVLDLRTLHEY